MGFWAAAAPALIAAGGSILGGLFNRGGGTETPENPPDYDWIKQYGPEMWGYLKQQGYDLNNNPYGLGEAKPAMQGIARGSAAAGYGSAQRNINTGTAVSGLSTGGGQYARQQVTAGREFGQDLDRSMSAIEVQDYMAKEEQRQRGLNLLMSISNKSPVYSQIASQNYWNALNASNMQSQNMYGMLGQAAGAGYEAYLTSQFLQSNPYGGQNQDYGRPGYIGMVPAA